MDTDCHHCDTENGAVFWAHMMHLQEDVWIRDGDDEDEDEESTSDDSEESADPGDEDLGDDAGERVGEHEEDPF